MKINTNLPGSHPFDTPNPQRDQLLELYNLPVSATDEEIAAAAVAARAPNSLRERLITKYKLPATATDEEIAAAAEAAQDENISEKARRVQEAADEVVIKQKTDLGLTRAQAIATIERQRKYDATVQAERAARRPRLIEIIKSCAGRLREARALAGEEFIGLDSGEFKAVVKDLETQAAAAS